MVPVAVPAHFHDVHAEGAVLMRQSRQFTCRPDPTRRLAHLGAERVGQLGQVRPATDRTSTPGSLTVVLRSAQQHRIGVAQVIPQSVAHQTPQGRTTLHDIVHNLTRPGGVRDLFGLRKRLGYHPLGAARRHAGTANRRNSAGGSHPSRVRSAGPSRPVPHWGCYAPEIPVTDDPRHPQSTMGQNTSVRQVVGSGSVDGSDK